ncbi:MAG: hypothetical protein HQ591_10125 [candidate division Zixibacteria bacterium]|nr:hypothetical protein [Candidatus Tariuqbacter arcticus]
MGSNPHPYSDQQIRHVSPLRAARRFKDLIANAHLIFCPLISSSAYNCVPEISINQKHSAVLSGTASVGGIKDMQT